MLLCAVLLAFFPLLILKKGYSLHDVIVVGSISAVIMAVRACARPRQCCCRRRTVQGTGGHWHAVGHGFGYRHPGLLLAFGPIRRWAVSCWARW